MRMIESGFPAIGGVILHIFNTCITRSDIPSEWKHSIVHPIIESGNPSDPSVVYSCGVAVFALLWVAVFAPLLGQLCGDPARPPEALSGSAGGSRVIEQRVRQGGEKRPFLLSMLHLF